MSIEDKRRQELDDFWDISSLVPDRKSVFGHARSTEGMEIRVSDGEQRRKSAKAEEVSESGSVIKRYIPPNTEEKLSGGSFEDCVSYTPSDSLLHRVTLKKWKCAYHYYDEFLRDAIRYEETVGEECAYVPFFSYVPQYNQLNEEQLAYYFWFRENARRGSSVKIDYSYILLYIYELINLGDRLDVKKTQYTLTALWNEYHKSFPALSGKLADWICDFSLIHRLSPPVNGGSELVNRVIALKEFFIAMPRGDMVGCARSLLKYCTSYDFHTSKFAVGENLELFETHMFEALLLAVRYYSADGRMLSGVSFDDSKIVRDAYAGALCVAKEKYRIEVDYCSFSRSNELRFLVGDILKYAENKLRTYLGVKSKMAVYSVPTELRVLLDQYFAEALPAKRVQQVAKEKQAYEALYDVPEKPFSLSDALRIERDSWGTTKDLIEAFEEPTKCREPAEAVSFAAEPAVASIPVKEDGEEKVLKRSLGEWSEAVCKLLDGHAGAIAEAARAHGKLPDALADEINEIAYEVIGDALIEEAEGGYAVIEDYRDLLM